MPRPIVASIDRSALAHNLDRVRELAPGAFVWAVVKADAYGHGIAAAAQGFAAADGLALIEIGNAIRLRELGWKKPILLLEGCFSALDWHAAAEHRLNCVIHCDEQLSEFIATPLARRVDVHLKFNTGMNRLGFLPEHARELLERLAPYEGVGSITLMTHFACADEPGGIDEPLRRFQEATRGLPYARSLANSAACFDFTHLAAAAPSPAVGHPDSVRPGIMLYGATPFTHASRSAASLGLAPAMTLRSAIIGVQPLEPGARVGYGGGYTATRRERIGVVACGYADGYPRHAPSGTPVLVDGQRTRLVGRVSMDKITVDLTELPHAQVGTAVELWGKRLAVDEVANAAGTIGYELLTAVAARVPRDVV
ncbi:MAG: alanine racemase [Burkholderiales bacterium]|nr:alanine racemase [Burkholderiales bacterium]